MRHALVFLLLLSSALSFSQHRVHKKDGHQTASKHPSPKLAEHQTIKSSPLELHQPEEVEKAETEDFEIDILEDSDAAADTKLSSLQGNVENAGTSHENDKDPDNSKSILEKSKQGKKDVSQQEAICVTKEEGMEASKDMAQEHGDIDKDIEFKVKTIANDIRLKRPVKSASNNQSLYAFSAELADDKEVAFDSIIVFNNILVNEGGLYFDTSGQFACTDEGVYVFMWSVRQTGSGRGLAALALRGQSYKTGPQTSYYSNAIYNGNSHMTAVIRCTTSPITAVTVRSMYDDSPIYTAGYTSFSGFRLALNEASTVAFTADLSENISRFPGSRIMFERVVTNIGNHFDGRNGFFRCPDDGIYSFTLSAYYPNADDRWSVTRLMRDGMLVMRGPVTYQATPNYDSGSSSITVLLPCNEGKDFYVEAEESYTFEYNQYGVNLTSFSGFRLCLDCDNLVAFSAVLIQNMTTNDEDIPFSNVLLNKGDAYGQMTGVFTCPDSAYYMFQFSGTSISGNCQLHLYVNNVLAKSLHMTMQGTAVDSGTSGTTSQSALVRCSNGHKVSVRAGGLSISRILLAQYSSFSAYRLPFQ